MNPEDYIFVDERLLGKCAFCGEAPVTRDPVPPTILLDDPLPEDLGAVESCAKCNQEFSVDDGYVACFLECVAVGWASVEDIGRSKVKRVLEHNPTLATQIRSAVSFTENGVSLTPAAADRIKNVVLKLARGHVAFELSRIAINQPSRILIRPLSNLSAKEREEFEHAGAGEIRECSEINSRALLRAIGEERYSNSMEPWIIVQPGRYRYTADGSKGVKVQIVISEYLACVIVWE